MRPKRERNGQQGAEQLPDVQLFRRLQERDAAKDGGRVSQPALSQRLRVRQRLHGRRGLGHALPDHDARAGAAAAERAAFYRGAGHEPGVPDARRRVAPQGLAGHDGFAPVRSHHRGRFQPVHAAHRVRAGFRGRVRGQQPVSGGRGHPGAHEAGGALGLLGCEFYIVYINECAARAREHNY